MEQSTKRPERCLNMHFYQPAVGMNMVDVMGGSKTDPQVMEASKEWVRSIGCVPLTVKKELLGFCFNRVWRAVKRETLYMWAEGFVDFRDVDKGWMIFTGMPMGPFGLMDQVGLDVIYDIEMVYYEDSKAAIYVDGPPHDYPDRQQRDAVQTDKMADAGYTVVRFKHTDNWQNVIAEFPSIFGKG
jgi:3-hydroxyacyl-CoA dehydrogenase